MKSLHISNSIKYTKVFQFATVVCNNNKKEINKSINKTKLYLQENKNKLKK